MITYCVHASQPSPWVQGYAAVFQYSNMSGKMETSWLSLSEELHNFGESIKASFWGAFMKGISLSNNGGNYK